MNILLNVFNDKAIIELIVNRCLQNGKKLAPNMVDWKSNKNVGCIQIDESRVYWWSTDPYNGSSLKYDIKSFSDCDAVLNVLFPIKKTVAPEKKKTAKFNVGERVFITNNLQCEGVVDTILEITNHSGGLFLVELDESEPLANKNYVIEKVVVYGMHLNEPSPNPVYLDEVVFTYSDGKLRNINVLKEDMYYIEGHKVGTTDYRKYSKSKINGKIYSSNKM